MNRLETFNYIFSLLLLCQDTLSSPIPTPLLFVLQKWIVYLPLHSHSWLLVFEEWVDTPIRLEMSVITYLITLLSYSRIAHCSANLSGHLFSFSAWSFTIPFNARSPMLPEKLFADPNFSMLCGILAKACILGKFHPQPSSLVKHSFIRLMKMLRASIDCLTCDLVCDSLTQHSNDTCSFRQFLNFSRRFSYLSFPSTSIFALNVCAWHKVT